MSKLTLNAEKLKKDAMLKALEASLGIVSIAARNVGIHRSTHYNWLKDDPEYKAAAKDIENIALDFAESKLHGLINNSDTAATIFYLKTKGKNRGYVERQEMSMMDSEIKVIIPQIKKRNLK